MPETQPPMVISTFPAAGQAVDPGVIVLKITFNQRMTKTGFDFTQDPGGEMPACLKTPRLLDDDKTFVLLCTTGRNKTYALAFNATPIGGFRNLADKRAQPASLVFVTTAGEPVRSLPAALKVAGLRDIDGPIQKPPDF